MYTTLDRYIDYNHYMLLYFDIKDFKTFFLYQNRLISWYKLLTHFLFIANYYIIFIVIKQILKNYRENNTFYNNLKTFFFVKRTDIFTKQFCVHYTEDSINGIYFMYFCNQFTRGVHYKEIQIIGHQKHNCVDTMFISIYWIYWNSILFIILRNCIKLLRFLRQEARN